MILEHFVYSAAMAIVAGMIYLRWTGRDPSWIMIAAALAPDIDLVIHGGLRLFGFTLLFEGHRISHGNFHNVLVAGLFAVAVAFLLHPFGVKFIDGMVFSWLGFMAHLVEDALVYADSYAVFWPISTEVVGLGWLPRTRTILGLANPETLFVGLALLAGAIAIRCYVEGTWWLRENPVVRIFGPRN